MKPSTLSRTPLYQYHLAHGARMVEFAGWEMPILYGSIIEEHLQVRRSGGVFDVSHMGRLGFIGPDAGRVLERLCTRAITTMAEGQCRYLLVCNDDGGCRDDALVYRLAPQKYLMVCNAANRIKLLQHIDQMRGELEFDLCDETFDTLMIALQGPKVIDILSSVDCEIAVLKRYRFLTRDLFGARVMISRTGYTGEDGVEMIVPTEAAGDLVDLLGRVDSVISPAGLGARDTLRMEAAMPLYGHELTEDLDPLAAGLTFAVKLDKGEADDVGSFIGQEARRAIARRGSRRTLAGLRLAGRRTARQGMEVRRDGAEIGRVTSGCLSPTLGVPIAMAYLDVSHAETGGTVEVDLGRTSVRADVVALPFYKR